MTDRRGTPMTPRAAAADHRTRLLAGVPVAERRADLAGIPTAILEGGEGPPLVLLHGPGAHAAAWHQVLPGLARHHRVVAPDLPGHGATALPGDGLDANRVLAWLDELIDATCPSPPVLLGQLVGGAIAARFAADRPARLAGLVLVVPFGLETFEPTPVFAAALTSYLTDPNERSFDDLWEQCVLDLDALRGRDDVRWDSLKAHTLELAGDGRVARATHALMEAFGFAPIPEAALARIGVPTALIWGRQDAIVPVGVGERASARHGCSMRVIEDAGNEPAIEAPDAFLAAVLSATRAAQEAGR